MLIAHGDGGEYSASKTHRYVIEMHLSWTNEWITMWNRIMRHETIVRYWDKFIYSSNSIQHKKCMWNVVLNVFKFEWKIVLDSEFAKKMNLCANGSIFLIYNKSYSDL